MRPSPAFLTQEAEVLDQVKGTPGTRLGQASSTWQPGEYVPCRVFPVSSQGVRRAQLLELQATHEIYLEQVDLDPLKSRLSIDGREYVLRDVREWDGLTVVLAQEA